MTTQIKPRPLEENASYTRFGHNSAGATATGLGLGGAALAGAIAGGMSGLIMTGSLKGMLKGALIGGLSAGIAHKIGTAFINSKFSVAGKLSTAGKVLKTVAHSTASGVINKLQGGSFGKGFASAFISTGAYASELLGNSAFAAGVVGGISSKVAGGNFAQGFAQSYATVKYNHHAEHKKHARYGINRHAGHAHHSSEGGNPNPDGITRDQMRNGHGTWEINTADKYHQVGVDPDFPNEKWNDITGHEEVFDYEGNPVRDHNGPTFNVHPGNLNPLHVLDILEWKVNGTGWPADKTESSDRCIIVGC